MLLEFSGDSRDVSGDIPDKSTGSIDVAVQAAICAPQSSLGIEVTLPVAFGDGGTRERCNRACQRSLFDTRCGFKRNATHNGRSSTNRARRVSAESVLVDATSANLLMVASL